MKITWLLFTLLFYIPLFSQTVTVSEELSVRSDEAYEIIGKMKDRFLLYRDKANNEYEIQAFNENLYPSWTKELEFEKKRIEVIGIVPDEEYFSILYRYKKKGETYLRANKYDPAANLIDSTLIFDFGNRYYPPRLTLIRSEDRSKVLLYHAERQSKIEVFCFDIKAMQLLWKNEFEPEGMAFHIDFQQALVTNDGAMYYILGKDNRKSSREKHVYEVYFADANSPQGNLNYITFSMEEMMTFDILFKYDNLNNNIIGAGLYSEKNRGKANGYLFLKAPASRMDEYELSFKAFDDKFVSDFTGKSVKNNKGIPETIVKEIVLRQDGGAIMIAERNKLLERAMSANIRGSYLGEDGRSYIVDYHIEDIMAVSIHPNGETHWESILPKRQYSQDDDAIYSSFFLLKTPHSLRLLFNDEIKYENTVSEYVVRGNGDYDRNSVLSTFNQKLQLRFRAALQVGSSELIIPSERKNKLRLVKVVY